MLNKLPKQRLARPICIFLIVTFVCPFFGACSSKAPEPSETPKPSAAPTSALNAMINEKPAASNAPAGASINYGTPSLWPQVASSYGTYGVIALKSDGNDGYMTYLIADPSDSIYYLRAYKPVDSQKTDYIAYDEYRSGLTRFIYAKINGTEDEFDLNNPEKVTLKTQFDPDKKETYAIDTTAFENGADSDEVIALLITEQRGVPTPVSPTQTAAPEEAADEAAETGPQTAQTNADAPKKTPEPSMEPTEKEPESSKAPAEELPAGLDPVIFGLFKTP